MLSAMCHCKAYLIDHNNNTSLIYYSKENVIKSFIVIGVMASVNGC